MSPAQGPGWLAGADSDAAEMVRMAGTALVVTRTASGGGVVDPIADVRTPPGSALDYDVRAVILPADVPDGLSAEENARIRTRARKLLVAAKGLSREPEVGDRVRFEEADWVFRSVETLRPDGATPILHTCQVER